MVMIRSMDAREEDAWRAGTATTWKLCFIKPYTRGKASCLLWSAVASMAGVPTRKPSPCPSRSRFGKNVAKLRHREAMTQEALAEAVGLSVRYIQSLEAGEYFPALPTLMRVRQHLRASWDEVFAGCE
jgi:DNA-binding XRE family transcriptional regulator